MNNNNQKESLLPPPELLERYELISKGLSKELVNLIKKEQEHRHKMQKKYLMHFRIGQFFGCLFLITIIYGIFELIKNKDYLFAYITLAIFSFIILLILFQYRKDKLLATIKNSNKNKFYSNKNFYKKKY